MARGRSYPEDLRARLVTAAAERLVTASPEELSLRELAASQDTSTNAIYSLFGGKPALITAVVEEVTEGFRERQQEALALGDTLEALYACGAAYREWALEHPALYRLLFDGGIGLPLSTYTEAAMEPSRNLVASLVERGLLVDTPAPELLHRSLWAATHGFLLLEMADHRDPAVGELQYRAHQELVLRGMLTEAVGVVAQPRRVRRKFSKLREAVGPRCPW